MAFLSESSTTFVVPNITQLVSVKLNDINYLNWTTQLTTDLRSHDLSSIVNGSNPCAPQFIVNDTGKTTSDLNPAYLLWQKWLIYPYMDKCHIIWEIFVNYLWTKLFHQVWTTLVNHFAPYFRSRISHLERQLHSLN